MFFVDLNMLIEDIASSPGFCLICGDFNFHMDSISSNVGHLNDILCSSDLYQHVNFPTHLKGHTLDLIISNTKEDVSDLRHFFDLPSDHASITCLLNLPRPPRVKVFSSHRKVRNIDIKSFVKDLSQLPEFVSFPSDLS